MSATFTAGLVQMAPAKTKAASLQKAASLVAEAAAAGASVICLPELFATPYFCRTQDHAAFDLAEPIPGPTTQALAKAARAHDATVLAPLFERRGPGLYHNSLAVLGPNGELIGIYRKMHIPHDPGFEEKFYFTPGDLGFRAFPTPDGTIGALICWDQWFPEAARATALLGALILFYPTAIGWHPSEKAEFGPTQLDAWQTVQRAHAITNGLYVAAVNRVGTEGKGKNHGGTLEFWGSSFVADPMGRIIAKAPTDAETILTADIDPAFVEQTRRHWPFLRDRRIDAYDGLLDLWAD
ncbi:carbon-nitrogen hydrolase [Desulfolutivibrio sulfoxidireducens]|uniref:carbon-nitrogen hydrolase n=1 Tax=Desulfolutivibrio sulfoxidireducens TaxID=2773299 RepID=UPI00159D3EF3|nr:carbon-nitrogen hydrolase [Desulfolutivibrio sulfoxidireducens]QLA21058.1 acyltransferase [Desulfolutivibrio sulfoxidireducens]